MQTLSMSACLAPTATARPASRRVARASASTQAAQSAGQLLPGANQLDALAKVSRIVADTGDIEAIRRLKPVDATTNPSLVTKAAMMPEYQDLVHKSLAKSKGAGDWEKACSSLVTAFGVEIARVVPGRVSVEVDASLSYDTANTVREAHAIVEQFEKEGLDAKTKLYVKMAATWEGIRACEILEKEGIACNVTLMFSEMQAAACADAGASLVSPFVGRILDWHKANAGFDSTDSKLDPGVLSVAKIFSYYKQHGYDTRVMAASFRNAGEIRELAGCDNITIAPALLDELAASTDPLYLRLDAEASKKGPKSQLISPVTHGIFTQGHNEDPCAKSKLPEGINAFVADTKKLQDFLKDLAGASA